MRARQKGQALPLGIAMILFGIIGGFVLYNTGQNATDKARLVNAADAAAYSGVVWQARALNFQAYTNRAMVANQVSMAQAVSLQSWLNYGVITGDNLAKALAGIPVINGIAQGVASAIQGVEQVAGPVAGAMLGVVDAVNAGVAAAQEGMFVSTFAATPGIVRGVAAASDPRFTADTAYSVIGALGNLEDWAGFTREVGLDDDEGMQRRADMIMESRDDFTKRRDWSLFGDYIMILPLISLDIDREGETRLVRSEDGSNWEWKAKDTLSFQFKRFRLFRSDKHWEVPIGWGQAFANSSSEGSSIEDVACTDLPSWAGGARCAAWLPDNHVAERFGDVGLRGLGGRESLTDMGHYGGLNPFRDLSPDAIAEDFPTLKLRVEVAMPMAGAVSTDAMGVKGEFVTGTQAPGDVLSSISIAEVFFKPPHAGRDPGEPLEFANAYSPYWDVRLSPVSAAERLAAFSMREHGGTAAPGSTRAPDAGTGSGTGSGYRSGNGLAAYGDGAGGAAGAGGLPAYGELSAAFGTDAGSVAGAAAGHVPGATDLVTEVGARFDGLVVDAAGIADTIREELQEALGNAARDILAGVIGDATGIRTGDELKAWGDARTNGAVTMIAETARNADVVVNEARAMNERIEPYLDAITTDVEILLTDALASYAPELDALRAIVDFDPAALGPDGQPLPVPGEEAIADARRDMRALEGELVDEVAQGIVDAFAAAQGFYVVRLPEARATVRFALKHLRERAVDALDWTPLFGGEDDSLGPVGDLERG